MSVTLAAAVCPSGILTVRLSPWHWHNPSPYATLLSLRSYRNVSSYRAAHLMLSFQCGTQFDILQALCFWFVCHPGSSIQVWWCCWPLLASNPFYPCVGIKHGTSSISCVLWRVWGGGVEKKVDYLVTASMAGQLECHVRWHLNLQFRWEKLLIHKLTFSSSLHLTLSHFLSHSSPVSLMDVQAIERQRKSP